MIVAVGVFVLMDTIAKYLSQWYPVPGIVWARYALNLLFLVAWFAARGELGRVRTSRPGIQLARGLLLAPYNYSALVWAMLLGLLVFGNFPDGWSLAGMAVIVASGLLIANRQRLTVRRT